MSRETVPFHAQFASPELVDAIVRGRLRASADPRWRESGADSAQEYELWAGAGCGMACLAPLALGELLSAVGGDEVVIASVSRDIRWAAGPRGERGGHLVLVLDVDPRRGRICFHNPSGHRPRTQRAVWIARERFARFYAGRGIAVTLPRERSSRERSAA